MRNRFFFFFFFILEKIIRKFHEMTISYFFNREFKKIKLFEIEYLTQ